MKKYIFSMLACTMVLLLTTGCGSKSQPEIEVEDYNLAIKDNDFDKAHDILKQLFDIYLEKEKKQAKLERVTDEDILNAARNYSLAAKDIYGAEIRYIYANDKESAEARILNLLTEVPQMGEKIPEGTSVKYGFGEDNRIILSLYCIYADCINSISNKVLQLAINDGDKRIASVALSNFVETTAVERDDFNVKYSDEAIFDAQKLFRNARVNGAFGEEEAVAAKEEETKLRKEAESLSKDEDRWEKKKSAKEKFLRAHGLEFFE